jgi:glycosyl-4,4'-diaponeurosporenoate acyltransferase
VALVGPPGIRRWKRWIPDGGPVLPGGVSKASLARRDPVLLRRLLLETRRAELVHWLLWPAALLTALWLPPDGVLVNLLFATLFNLPCLLLQRFNRRRLQRCLQRLTAAQAQGPRKAACSSSATTSP